MQIINIESFAFGTMRRRFDQFIENMDALLTNGGDKKLDKWLDGNDVCEILSISKRTLQTYRDRGRLSFSNIGNKIYYRPTDVQKMVERGGKERCIAATM